MRSRAGSRAGSGLQGAPAFARPSRTLGRWALAGLALGLLLGLLSFAPARWLARALPSNGVLQLLDARGTVWQGSAQLWLTGGAGSPDRAALPGRLHWRLAFAAGPGLEMRADCCTPQPLQLRLGLQGGQPTLGLTDGASLWPADVLRGLGTPWNTLEPRGRLALQTQGLAVRWQDGAWRLAGEAALDLQDVSSALSTLQPMGSYRLALTGGPAPRLTLQTLQGDLQLQGEGQWSASRLQFRGEARAAPGRDEALAHILHIIGKRDGARTLFSLG